MSGYRWYPDHTNLVLRPNPGDLVAVNHEVWRVIEVNDRPEVDWSGTELARIARLKPEIREKYRPFVMVIRPVKITGDDPRAGDHDRHLSYRGRDHYFQFDVYRDEHYPVCNVCGEPTPCRERIATRVGEQAMKRMARYESPDHCPTCEGVITSRQRSITFPDNLVSPLGPPVTFHRRGSCRRDAAEYEKKWVAADPESRRLTLSCPGRVTSHGDSSYDCTEALTCPGPTAFHSVYAMCGCCPREGSWDCSLWPHYSLRPADRTAGETP